ncbi:glycosyl hydrolase family 8 [Rhizobium halophytocola]|uniref:cellulase n=1 Tax=Rhizobium halophytocola TaxID=735519 RepID=A0ABS4DV21_9HYPH|nr:glycosyl hydrolase family 8 [Rhizobium halophytocola]MBP1849542.1 endoglucanase [Rhizobium halophytocola]
MRAAWRSAITGLALTLTASASSAAGPSVTAAEWETYKQRFVDPSGRVIDNANGNISHSEGQGYGMLLAYLAARPDDFSGIWDFTRSELLLRDDGLAMWKWDPSAHPHITDRNNATDGDILIAYALALGGAAWQREDYLRDAAKIAKGVLGRAVADVGGHVVLLPGARGFRAKDREDGPVVNPSYWVFEALPILKLLAPSEIWDALAKDGLSLLRAAQFGPARLPSEWISLREEPHPAEGFDRQFSYNAVRIPLYLLRGGIVDKPLLERLSKGMTGPDGKVSVIDITSGRPVEPLPEAGYQIINPILACVFGGTPLPREVTEFSPAHYYPATLQLLGLSFVRENHPECL